MQEYLLENGEILPGRRRDRKARNQLLKQIYNGEFDDMTELGPARALFVRAMAEKSDSNISCAACAYRVHYASFARMFRRALGEFMRVLLYGRFVGFCPDSRQRRRLGEIGAGSSAYKGLCSSEGEHSIERPLRVELPSTYPHLSITRTALPHA